MKIKVSLCRPIDNPPSTIIEFERGDNNIHGFYINTANCIKDIDFVKEKIDKLRKTSTEWKGRLPWYSIDFVRFDHFIFQAVWFDESEDRNNYWAIANIQVLEL